MEATPTPARLQPRNDQLSLKSIKNVRASARHTAPLAIALRSANTRLMKAILREKWWELTCKIEEAADSKTSSDEANDIKHPSDQVLRE